MSRTQLNVRVSDVLERAIDEKRIELRGTLGTIPSRSEVLRLALEAYLGMGQGMESEDANCRETTSLSAGRKIATQTTPKSNG